jgi:hypothetical protein
LQKILKSHWLISWNKNNNFFKASFTCRWLFTAGPLVGHQTEGDQEEEGPNPCTKAKGLIPFRTKRVKAGAEECKKAVILSAYSKPLWKSRNRRDRKNVKKGF